MGVKSITNHLNAAGIRTRDGGRSGVGTVHKVLTRTAYIGRHRFNTRFWKTRQRKPESEVVEMSVPPIIEPAEFEAVQALLKTRSPALTAPRIVSGPTLLTGICFCAACGRAMTLRTGKGGQYRYYTCSTKARQGETGCKGRTVPMDCPPSALMRQIRWVEQINEYLRSLEFQQRAEVLEPRVRAELARGRPVLLPEIADALGVPPDIALCVLVFTIWRDHP